METREVYTLVIECGRRPGDYLPQRATGARLLCYVPGRDESDAVTSAVAVIFDAGMEVLGITNYGTLGERLAEGEIGEAERLLIERAEREDTVVIGELTPLFEKGPGSH